MVCDRRYGLTSQKMPSSVDPNCIGDLFLSSNKGQEFTQSTVLLDLTKKGTPARQIAIRFCKLLFSKSYTGDIRRQFLSFIGG